MFRIKFGLKTSLRDFIIKVTLHNTCCTNVTIYTLVRFLTIMFKGIDDKRKGSRILNRQDDGQTGVNIII